MGVRVPPFAPSFVLRIIVSPIIGVAIFTSDWADGCSAVHPSSGTRRVKLKTESAVPTSRRTWMIFPEILWVSMIVRNWYPGPPESDSCNPPGAANRPKFVPAVLFSTDDLQYRVGFGVDRHPGHEIFPAGSYCACEIDHDGLCFRMFAGTRPRCRTRCLRTA
jgi:hypothetical protein